METIKLESLLTSLPSQLIQMSESTIAQLLGTAADTTLPLVQAATPTTITWYNVVEFLNSESTWQWRIIALLYFVVFFAYCLGFTQVWNWSVADMNIGLKSEETTADESV